MRTTLIKKGVREIWSHKLQYLLLILVLGMGIATYGSLHDMIKSREATLNTVYEKSNFMDIRLSIQYGETLNHSIVKEILNSEEVRDMVVDAEYRLILDVFINQSFQGSVKTTRGEVFGYEVFTSDNERRELEVNKPLFYSNNPPFFDGPAVNEGFIEYHYSKVYGLHPGDSISLIRGDREINLTILGRVNIPEYFFVIKGSSFLPSERSFGSVMVPIGTAMKFLGVEGEEQVNDIVLHLKDPKIYDEFESKVREEFQKRGIIVSASSKSNDLVRNYLYNDLKNDKQSMGVFPIVIFAVAGFGLIMTLRRMIRTHRTQIGIFKSLGIPNRTILVYFLIIGLIILILGTFTGIILSIPLRMIFIGAVKTIYGFAIIKSSLAWDQYLVAIWVGIFISLSCTILPAYFALRIKPVDAIQSREGISKRSTGRLATSIVNRASIPVPIRLSIRNFFRKPAKTISNISGVALSMTLFLGFMIFLHSVVSAIENDAMNNLWDYEVTMNGFSEPSAFSNLGKEFSEVRDVNTGILLSTRIKKDGYSEGIQLYGLSDTGKDFNLKFGSGSLESGKLVISSYISEKFGIGEGDIVTLELPFLNEYGGFNLNDVDIVVSGVQTNLFGTYIFMKLYTIQNISNLDGVVNVIYIHTKNGEQVRGLENRLMTDSNISTITFIGDRANMLNQYFSLILEMAYIMGVISAILSMAILYNLFMIDANEKKREYATMKTLGTVMRKIANLIIIESVLVTTFGIAFGVIGGLGLAYYMISSSEVYAILNVVVVFTWFGFTVGAAIIIAVTTIVSLLTLHYISRINIANEIRERSSG